jgi:radical SAM enzyme (TIGR01210 family)
MCDLWKNTTNSTVPPGAIPQQIDFALKRLPSVKHIKLYNSGNFFDQKAIPQGDFEQIASQLTNFETVLVENHPKLMGNQVLRFQDMLQPKLHVAIGLETTHPQVLPLLNKQMTLDDFSSAVAFLNENDILTRAFILLRPPFLNEAEGVEWAIKSIDFAFGCGVECCTIIPTRSGNGAMEMLEKQGLFESPRIKSLEEVLDYGIGLKKGRVFADLWDLSHFSACKSCYEERKDRLQAINTQQQSLPEIECRCS